MVQGKPAFGDRSRRFARHAGANTREAKGVMIRTLYFTTVAVVMTSWTLVESINTISELLAWTAIPIGAVTLARAHWKTSTRAIRERIAMLTNAVRHALPTGNVEGAPPDADDK